MHEPISRREYLNGALAAGAVAILGERTLAELAETQADRAVRQVAGA